MAHTMVTIRFTGYTPHDNFVRDIQCHKDELTPKETARTTKVTQKMSID